MSCWVSALREAPTTSTRLNFFSPPSLWAVSASVIAAACCWLEVEPPPELALPLGHSLDGTGYLVMGLRELLTAGPATADLQEEEKEEKEGKEEEADPWQRPLGLWVPLQPR